MFVPLGMTEPAVLDTIEAVVRSGPNFQLLGTSVEDVAQEGRPFALELLEKATYDPNVGPLAGYVLSHVRNRLINLRRDLVSRSDAPCKRCHLGDPCGENGHFCKPYEKWANRQNAKSAVNSPVSLEGDDRIGGNASPEGSVEINELLQLLDARVGIDDRRLLLQMRVGVKLPKLVRRRVESAVLAVLEEVGISRQDVGLPNDEEDES